MSPTPSQPAADMTNRIDSGLHCLLQMAKLHGLAADAAQLQHQFGRDAFDVQTVLLAARRLGMKAKVVTQAEDRLDRAPLPAVAIDRNGDFFLLGRVDTTSSPIRALLQVPGQPPEIVDLPQLRARWSGELIYFTSKASFSAELSKFDFTWFIPAIVKYRKTLGEVLLISLVLQVLGLVTPMFFQVVMDKVLVNQAMTTLNVVAIGLIAATVFEASLSGIRTAVFANTSSKIDVELGARLFGHMLSLPISYFQARRAGDSVARIRELENIRSFLTGNAMTLVLDVLFSGIFITVMLWYSTTLTWLVLGSIPVYLALSLIFTPILRTRLNDKFNKGAENQSFLVETLGGMDTIKCMALEPRWQRKWDQQLAGYVAAGLSTANISLVASGGVTLVSKLVTVGIMWLGALLVMDNQLTVGELIAFNMLAGQVSAPILRMAQLWNDFQQVGISMSRLGDILNTHTESASSKSRMPTIAGAIEFDQVSFRYQPDAPDVIRSVTLKVQPGEVIGIVGRSGSGKSTLTKLVQRLHVPGRGRISIDGHDIATADSASLRQQMGVVLQENTLFSCSIRDNIALSDPSLALESIMAAAKLAGAHDFICELAQGYDTWIGENGTGLSGGQRQRIAIARALISNPRILIFDEATSALDYESERIIQDNMSRISAGRTVLIIAHRLSAVRDADRIIVMDRGQIVEEGNHSELLKNPHGIYSHLNRLQSGTSARHAFAEGAAA